MKSKVRTRSWNLTGDAEGAVDWDGEPIEQAPQHQEFHFDLDTYGLLPDGKGTNYMCGNFTKKQCCRVLRRAFFRRVDSL